MKEIGEFLVKNTTISIFICLALGYLVGKLRYKSFSLGATVGTLIVGLIIGQVGIFDISPVVKSIFFSLFVFTIGYEVGPSFFNSLKKSGAKIIIHSIFFSVSAFAVAIICFKIFKVGPGEGAGIIAGALTQSSVIGTSTSAINGLDLTSVQKATMESNVAIAYALTYVFGTVGVIILLKNIAPILLGINLKEETKKMIEKISFKADEDSSSVINNIKMRSFIVDNNSVYIGKTISDIEKRFSNNITFEKLFRDKLDFDFNQESRLEQGDFITLIGDLDDMIKIASSNLTEISDSKYQSISLKESEIVLTKAFSIKNLKELYSNNIMLVSVKRNGKVINDTTEMKNGDLLTIIGPKCAIGKVVKEFGYIKDVGIDTDVSYLSLGVALGLLVGGLSLKFHNIPITLGSGGGALFLGLFFGWYQNKNPRCGQIPPASRWLLKSMGLNLFIAVVGIEAGHAFLPALKSMGVSVLLIGAIVSIVPHILSIYFGKYILKLDAVDIIGSLCGAGTTTAALNSITEECGSSIFAISYTPAYAVGNILITMIGPLMVSLLA